jgi:hypothetical protein
LNRSQVDQIALAIASRVDEVERSDQYQDIKLQELRISAARIAKNLGLDEVKFLKRCGFRMKMGIG